jgi:hypothetical protein
VKHRYPSYSVCECVQALISRTVNKTNLNICLSVCLFVCFSISAHTMQNHYQVKEPQGPK